MTTNYICRSCNRPVNHFDFLCDPPCCADLTVTRILAPTEDPDTDLGDPPGPDLDLPVLELVVGAQSFSCKDGAVLGRKGTLARHLFKDIDTVSRQHLFLCLEDSVWRVSVGKNVPNSTTLDGVEMERGQPYPLEEGEYEITMSRDCKIILSVSIPGESEEQ